MEKIEHIGIAVRDLEEANARFARLFGQAHYKIESVESEGVNTSFFQMGESKIELLESTDPNGPIGRFLDKRGEGVHHIAFAVTDIQAEMARLQSEG
ncbi:MAG: VOC family protein, partial [Bacteroidota bacterium]